jgi:hypothetical protein
VLSADEVMMHAIDRCMTKINYKLDGKEHTRGASYQGGREATAQEVSVVQSIVM